MVFRCNLFYLESSGGAPLHLLVGVREFPVYYCTVPRNMVIITAKRNWSGCHRWCRWVVQVKWRWTRRKIVTQMLWMRLVPPSRKASCRVAESLSYDVCLCLMGSKSTTVTSRLVRHSRLLYPLTSALTLLVGQQEGHPACKNWVVECWHGICLDSGVRCRFAYRLADATAAHYLLLQ